MSDAAEKAQWVTRVLGVKLQPASNGAGVFADLEEFGLEGIDLWDAAQAAFEEANEAVDAQITTLVAALRASDDAEMQEVAEMGLSGLTENVKVPLRTALLEAGTGNKQKLIAAAPKVLAAVAAFRAKITSDPRIEACDGNPLDIPVDIVGTFEPALAQLEEAVEAAAG